MALIGPVSKNESAPDTAPALPAGAAGDGQSNLAAEMQRRAGRTLESMHVEPVDAGHPHYPPSQKFNVIGDTVYVRREDAAGLQDAILRRRAANQGSNKGE